MKIVDGSTAKETRTRRTPIRRPRFLLMMVLHPVNPPKRNNRRWERRRRDAAASRARASRKMPRETSEQQPRQQSRKRVIEQLYLMPERQREKSGRNIMNETRSSSCVRFVKSRESRLKTRLLSAAFSSSHERLSESRSLSSTAFGRARAIISLIAPESPSFLHFSLSTPSHPQRQCEVLGCLHTTPPRDPAREGRPARARAARAL